MSLYQYLQGMVGISGLLYFGGIFAIACGYALRPSKKALFDDAARMPLRED